MSTEDAKERAKRVGPVLHVIEGGAQRTNDDGEPDELACRMIVVGERLQDSLSAEQRLLWNDWIDLNAALMRRGTDELKTARKVAFAWKAVAEELSARPISVDLLAIADALMKASIVPAAMKVTKLCAAMMALEKGFPDLYRSFSRHKAAG